MLINIFGTMTDRIEIPTVNLGLSTTASSKQGGHNLAGKFKHFSRTSNYLFQTYSCNVIPC